MNNLEVEKALVSCENEINDIVDIVNAQGQFHKTTPFLNKYCVIKACGTIEAAFKSIISDFCMKSHICQINNYIDKKIRLSSMNPSWENICSLLKEFDATWQKSFKSSVNTDLDSSRLKSSLKSLNENRNEFAHGGNPTVSVMQVLSYYKDARKIMEYLDVVIQ